MGYERSQYIKGYLQVYRVFRIRIRIGSGINQVNGSVSGPGSRRAKITHTNREKKLRNYMF
jgi:hypothetical protein